MLRARADRCGLSGRRSQQLKPNCSMSLLPSYFEEVRAGAGDPGWHVHVGEEGGPELTIAIDSARAGNNTANPARSTNAPRHRRWSAAGRAATAPRAPA